MRDILYLGHKSAIKIQKMVRGVAGRSRCAGVREEISLMLLRNCKESARLIMVDHRLPKLETDAHSMSYADRYSLLEEYAQTLNVTLNSHRPEQTEGGDNNGDDMIARDNCIRQVHALSYGALIIASCCI